MPQFDSSVFIGQIFWLIISFGILYIGVYFFVFPMFNSIFTARQKLIDTPLEKAEKITQDTQVIEQKIEKNKLLIQKHHEEKLNSVHQKEFDHLQEALKKADESLSGAFKKIVQKTNRDESDVLKNADLFVQKVLRSTK